MQRNQWILDEVAYAQGQGMKVDVCGIVCTDKKAEEISRVLQRGCYMLDYEGDSQGKLVALHIDLVEPFDKPSYHSSRVQNKGVGREKREE